MIVETEKYTTKKAHEKFTKIKPKHDRIFIAILE